jgi:hypothetical protein
MKIKNQYRRTSNAADNHLLFASRNLRHPRNQRLRIPVERHPTTHCSSDRETSPLPSLPSSAIGYPNPTTAQPDPPAPSGSSTLPALRSAFGERGSLGSSGPRQLHPDSSTPQLLNSQLPNPQLPTPQPSTPNSPTLNFHTSNSSLRTLPRMPRPRAAVAPNRRTTVHPLPQMRRCFATARHLARTLSKMPLRSTRTHAHWYTSHAQMSPVR